MFDFLITVFGGAYLGVKYLMDKSASEHSEWDAWNIRVSEEAWEYRHTSAEMEVRLLKIMDDPEYFQEISKEVISAFAQMPSWGDRKDSIFIRRDLLSVSKSKMDEKICRNTVVRERNVALDIMLANRGKVSVAAANFGYDSFSENMYGGKYINQPDELVHWIEKTLRDKGVDVRLSHKQNGSGVKKYVWVGSHAHNSTQRF